MGVKPAVTSHHIVSAADTRVRTVLAVYGCEGKVHRGAAGALQSGKFDQNTLSHDVTLAEGKETIIKLFFLILQVRF